jgi:hypothetical protein
MILTDARVGPTHPTPATAKDKETDGEHPQAGSCQTATDEGGKAGVGFLAQSKRGTRFRSSSLLSETKQRRYKKAVLRAFGGETPRKETLSMGLG